MTKIKPKKFTKRLLVFGLLCFVVNAAIIYSLFVTWRQIYDKKEEKENLSENLVTLKSKEEELKVEINKLQDSSYIARYAREKLFYSEKNEYIIKIK